MARARSPADGHGHAHAPGSRPRGSDLVKRGALCDPKQNAGEQDYAEERERQLLERRSDAAVALNLLEEVLDEETRLEDVAIVVPLHDSISTGRNDGARALGLNLCDDGTRIVALVGNDGRCSALRQASRVPGLRRVLGLR